MTPKELAESMVKRIVFACGGLPELEEEKRAALWRIIEYNAVQALSEAYHDAADYCDKTASEHTTNLYGKNELEMVAKLLHLRADGVNIEGE